MVEYPGMLSASSPVKKRCCPYSAERFVASPAVVSGWNTFLSGWGAPTAGWYLFPKEEAHLECRLIGRNRGVYEVGPSGF